MSNVFHNGVELRPVRYGKIADGYYADAHGDVYRYHGETYKKLNQKWLRPYGHGGSAHFRWVVSVTNINGVAVNMRVHRLVANAWLGERPPGLIVLHGANGPRDNSVANLSYGTHRKNVLDDRIRDGSFGFKLTESTVYQIWDEYNAGAKRSGIQVRYAISQSTVSAIIRGDYWHHVYLARAPQSERFRLEYPERHRELVSGIRGPDDSPADDALLVGSGAEDGALPCVPCGHDS